MWPRHAECVDERGGAASINLSNSSGGTMTVSDVSTVGPGRISRFRRAGGNRLRLVNVSAPAGNVTLSTAETINEALNDDQERIRPRSSG